VRLALLAFAALAVVALFVLPARTLVDQKHSLDTTQQRISTLSSENAKLKSEARQLQSNGTIEQIARSDYGLVMPGQRAYAVIPGTPAGDGGTTATTVSGSGGGD
jgi:cell division protein FtsB